MSNNKNPCIYYSVITNLKKVFWSRYKMRFILYSRIYYVNEYIISTNLFYNPSLRISEEIVCYYYIFFFFHLTKINNLLFFGRGGRNLEKLFVPMGSICSWLVGHKKCIFSFDMKPTSQIIIIIQSRKKNIASVMSRGARTDRRGSYSIRGKSTTDCKPDFPLRKSAVRQNGFFVYTIQYTSLAHNNHHNNSNNNDTTVVVGNTRETGTKTDLSALSKRRKDRV